jgi:hypothetical protein
MLKLAESVTEEAGMGQWLKKHGWQVLTGLVVGYLLFVMDLGGHSFMGHVFRISQTAEVRQLGQAVVDKVSDIAGQAKRSVLSVIR